MNRPIAAAAAALGVELTGVQELSRGRSLVLRARAGDRSVVLKAGPIRRAFLHHRLSTAPGEGPLADLAAETAAALVGAHGEHRLALAPAFR